MEISAEELGDIKSQHEQIGKNLGKREMLKTCTAVIAYFLRKEPNMQVKISQIDKLFSDNNFEIISYTNSMDGSITYQLIQRQ